MVSRLPGDFSASVFLWLSLSSSPNNGPLFSPGFSPLSLNDLHSVPPFQPTVSRRQPGLYETTQWVREKIPCGLLNNPIPPTISAISPHQEMCLLGDRVDYYFLQTFTMNAYPAKRPKIGLLVLGHCWSTVSCGVH